MRVVGAAIVMTAAGAAALVGCGSGSATHGSDCDGGCWHPSADDETFLAQLCGLTEACCVANAYRTAADVEGCKAQFAKAGVSRDQSLRSMCLAELQSLAAAGASCVPEVWNLSDPCVRISYEPSGPQAPGQPCTVRADCAGASGTVTLCTADPSAASPTGSICMRLARGKAGDEPCLGAVGGTGAIIAAPWWAPSAMMPPIATGVVCEGHAGLYCTPANDPKLRTCAPFLDDGATCDFSSTCASGECLTADGNTASESQPGSCTPRVSAGQTCQALAARTLCDDTSYCSFNGGAAGVCMARLPAGSACNDDNMCVSANCTTTNTCSAQTAAESLALLGFCARF